MAAAAEHAREDGARRESALGIVVWCGAGESCRPPVSAFVWGRKLEKRPPIPYGRWKDAHRG